MHWDRLRMNWSNGSANLRSSAPSAFANLERDIREQNNLKEMNAQDYKLYLGAKPLADTLQERQKALAASAEREAHAREHLRLRTEGFELANRDFDPAAL